MNKSLRILLTLQCALAITAFLHGSSHSSSSRQSDENGWRITVGNITTHSIRAMSMLEESRWWAGIGSEVASTSNGGATWDVLFRTARLATLEVSVFPPVQQIQFLNENKGWLLGNNLMTTDDGGKSWTNILLGSYPQSTVPVPRSFYFLDDKRGWVVGNVLEGSEEEPLAVLWETTDAGVHWREIRCLECDEREIFRYVAAMKDGDLFIVGDVIYKRARASSRFKKMKLDFSSASSRLTRVGIADQRTVWAETADGSYCFVSNDRGNSWSTVKPGREANQIVFLDDRRAYLVSRGDVFFSQDGGVDWRLDLRGDYRLLIVDRYRKVIAAIGGKIATKQVN